MQIYLIAPADKVSKAAFLVVEGLGGVALGAEMSEILLKVENRWEYAEQ